MGSGMLLQMRLLLWLAILAIGPARALSADGPNSDGAPLRYEAPKYLTGSIYGVGANRNRLLFKFTRVATRTGSTLDVMRDYRDVEGKLVAREHLVYIGD